MGKKLDKLWHCGYDSSHIYIFIEYIAKLFCWTASSLDPNTGFPRTSSSCAWFSWAIFLMDEKQPKLEIRCDIAGYTTNFDLGVCPRIGALIRGFLLSIVFIFFGAPRLGHSKLPSPLALSKSMNQWCRFSASSTPKDKTFGPQLCFFGHNFFPTLLPLGDPPTGKHQSVHFINFPSQSGTAIL